MSKYVRYEVQPRSPLRIITYHFHSHPKIRQHWHEYLEIIYLVRGQITLKIDRKTINARSGDIIVFNGFEVHESVSLSPDNEYYVFAVPPEFFQTVENFEGYRYDNLLRNSGECLACIKRAAAAVDEAQGSSQFLLNSEIFRFLYTATKNHTHTDDSATGGAKEAKLIVADIQKRISRCYAEPMSIDLLANAFCISVSHLQHTFKAQTGSSVIDCINRTRIDNAAELLRKTDLHISHISEKVGFSDYNYFSRVFKKYRAMTPSEYRKLSRG